MRAHGGTLAATEISKSHGGDVVLDRVSLVVPPRARIGVVGPNGAGKTRRSCECSPASRNRTRAE